MEYRGFRSNIGKCRVGDGRERERQRQRDRQGWIEGARERKREIGKTSRGTPLSEFRYAYKHNTLLPRSCSRWTSRYIYIYLLHRYVYVDRPTCTRKILYTSSWIFLCMGEMLLLTRFFSRGRWIYEKRKQPVRISTYVNILYRATVSEQRKREKERVEGEKREKATESSGDAEANPNPRTSVYVQGSKPEAVLVIGTIPNSYIYHEFSTYG